MGQLADKTPKTTPVGADNLALLDSEDLIGGKPKVKIVSITNFLARLTAITGKFLSTNDYDDTEKAKVAAAVTTAAMNAAIDAAKNALINGAPGALDTIKELADAMADDSAFSTTMINALALKQPITDNTFNTTSKTVPGAINELLGANNSITPRINLAFVPGTGVQLDRSGGTFYNQYNQSGALTLNIASGIIIAGNAILPIKSDGNIITISGATKDPNSHFATTVVNTTDRYLFWVDGLTVYYTITNLG